MTDMATKPGQAYAKDPFAEVSDDKRKIKKARKEALHIKEEKRDGKKGQSHLLVGQLESHFLDMGNSTKQLGDQPADFQSAFGAMEWITLPDHVEPGFCQLTDKLWTCTPTRTCVTVAVVII